MLSALSFKAALIDIFSHANSAAFGMTVLVQWVGHEKSLQVFAMKLFPDIHGPQRMYCNKSGDPLAFHLQYH